MKIAVDVDPAQPFVYSEGLEIRVYDVADTDTILQSSTCGDGSTSYRIDNALEQYITNFKTGPVPATYVVEVWRPSKNFMIDSFTFETTK